MSTLESESHDDQENGLRPFPAQENDPELVNGHEQENAHELEIYRDEGIVHELEIFHDAENVHGLGIYLDEGICHGAGSDLLVNDLETIGHFH